MNCGWRWAGCTTIDNSGDACLCRNIFFMQSPCPGFHGKRRTAQSHRVSMTPPPLVPITPRVSHRNRYRNEIISIAQKMAISSDSPDELSPRTRRMRKRVHRRPTPQRRRPLFAPSPRPVRRVRKYSPGLVEEYCSLMFQWMCSTGNVSEGRRIRGRRGRKPAP